MMRLGFLIVITAWLPNEALAQEHPAQWSLRVHQQTVAPAAAVTARLHAHIDQFWHLYSMTQPAGGPVAMRVALLPNAPFTLVGPIRAPAPDTIPDANFGILTQTYADSVTLTATARVKPGIATGPTRLAFAITYQTCTARYCLPARTDTVASAITVGHRTAPIMAHTGADSAAIAHVKSLYFAMDYVGGADQGAQLLTRFPRSRELMAWHVANVARTNHPRDAVSAAKAMLAANRVDPWGWFATTVALEYGGETSDRQTILDASRQALQRGPTNPDLVWLRALALGNNSQEATALALLDSVARHRPLTAEQLNLRAFALYSAVSVAGKIDTARRDSAFATYARVRALMPANVVAHVSPASRLLSMGRTAEAYQLAKQAVVLSPASLTTHRWLWNTVQTMKDRPQAERDAELTVDVEALLRLRGDEPESLQAAAGMFATLRLPDRQMSLEQRILSDFPNTVAAEWVLVNRYRELAKTLPDSTAIDSTTKPRYRRALWDYVDRPSHLEPELLGDAYRSLFFITDSTTAADTLLRIVRGMERYEGINPQIIYARGAIRLAERGVDFAAAERLARAGIPEGKKKIDGQRADYETVGEYADAVDGMAAIIYDALGWVYFHEDKLADAGVQLHHAAELDPKSSSVLFHLGRLAEKNGELAQAEASYIKGALVSVMGTNPNRKALEQLYRRQHGSLDGYQAYMDHLAETDRARRKAEIEMTRIAAPEPLLAFSLKSLAGHVVTLDSLKGKVAVINNWGMWCGPCVAEMPEFQKLVTQFADDSSVRILTIDANDPNVDELRDWLHKKGYTFQTLLDDGYVARVGIKEFPTTWVLDPTGRIVFKKAGWSEKLVEEFTWRIQLAR